MMPPSSRLPLLLAAVALVMGACSSDDKPIAPARQAPAAPHAITTKSGIAMVRVPAGGFLMGDAKGDDDEKPVHKVTLAAFYIDTLEVGQQAYEALVGKNPAKFKGPTRPVERVSWLAAIKYCNLRSLKEGLTPCYDAKTLACDFAADGYRLPTEAEWERACRANTTTRYAFGDAAHALGKHAWFKANAAKTTHPVGQKRPNAWGIHDMHGNVAEWCHDVYAEDAYTRASATDPHGPATGDERVLRGGSWRSSPERCRSAARDSEAPGFADVCFGYEAYGFRCVRRAPTRDPQ